MNLKKLLLILAILIVSIGGYAIYKYNFSNIKNQRSIYCIPQDAVFILETHNAIDNWKTIKAHPIWKYLQTNDYFSSISSNANTLDELLEKNKNLLHTFKSKSVLASLHMYTKRKYDFLYVIDLQKTASIFQFKSLLKSVLKKSFTVTERKYKEQTIIELYNQTSKKTLYLTVLENNLITSYTHILVENAIDEINNPTIGRDLKFIDVNKQVTHNDMLRIYIQYKYFDKFLGLYASKNLPLIQNITNNLSFSGFNFNLDSNSQVVANGYTNVEEGTQSYLESLQKSGIGTHTIAKIVPNTAALYLSIGFKDFDAFYTNYKNIQKQTPERFKTITENQKKVEDFLDINFETHFVSWMDDEIALINLKPSSLGKNNDFAVVISTKNKHDAKENIDFVLKQIKKKTPVKFKSIAYKKHDINYLSIKGFFKFILGDFLKHIDTPYFTIIEDYVVFSNHPNALKTIINAYTSGKTLYSTNTYKNLNTNFKQRSNIFAYINTPIAVNQALETVNTKTYAQLNKNKNYVNSFAPIALQLYPENDGFKTILAVNYLNTQASTHYTEQFVKPNLSAQDIAAPQDSTSITIEPIKTAVFTITNLNAKEHIEHFENDQLRLKVSLKKGVKHGNYREYYENGELKIRGRYKNGERNGTWKLYNKNGNLIEKVKY